MNEPEQLRTNRTDNPPPKRRPTGWAVWRPVIMPTEHGGWGFVLEPVLLGLLVAATWAGLLLGVATFATFLIRHPLKLLLIDRRRNLRTERTGRAFVVIATLGTIAGLAFLAALWLSDPAFLTPLLLALPIGAIYIYYDLTGPPRTLQAELTGPLAMGFVASSMAVMDGWSLLPALALWAALGLRSVPSVLYVRARIRLDRGRKPNLTWPSMAHGLALVGASALVWLELLPMLSLSAYAILWLRCVWFLSSRRPMVQIKTIGFMELGLGVFLVFTIALGVWL